MRNIFRLLAVVLPIISGTSLYAQTDSPDIQINLPMADYNSTPRKYIINDVKVSGIQFLDPARIAGTSGINVGDTVVIPGDYITTALRKMWSQRYYSDIKILVEPVDDDRVNIELVLSERPKVAKWTIDGVTSTERKDLLESLKLVKGGELSDYVLNSNKNAILKFMTDKGFRNATVDILQVKDEIYPNMVDVTFKVTKNDKVRIGRIEFEGNDKISSRKLRNSLKKTHQKSINFFQSSKFKEKDFEEDKELLLEYYRSKGFRNAVIVSDSIYDINNNRIGILLKVEEGEKFYIRNITWTGNSIYETEFLDGLLGISKGDVYDSKTLLKRLGIGRETDMEDPTTVSAQYQNKGYIFSEIEPAETVVGIDSLDINIKIFEGNQARINEVTISGNINLNEDVIRRELDVRPGELYDRSLLMSSLRELAAMDKFDQQTLAPNVVPVSNDRVDVSFPLTEKSSDQFNVSGGWGYNTFVASVGVQLTNVSTRNFFKKSAWVPYPKGQNQTLAIQAQTNGSYYKSISLNFFEPWLGGKRPNSLTVGFFYSSQNNATYAWQTGDQYFRTVGFSTGLGRRLNWPDRYFTLYNELAYQAYTLKDWDQRFIFSTGRSNIVSLKTTFGRNSVNNPIYPSGGSEFSLSVALTPPYSLFNNVNYADPNLSDQERYKWIEYHKWLLKGEWFYALTNNNKLVLRAKAEMGYLGAYNKNKVSPFERFDVGGDGMTGYSVYGVDVISLRGYDNGALTPNTGNNEYARAYNKYSLELRYPIIMGAQTIYGLVFAEAGNGFSNWGKFDPFLLKRSAGLGVRINLQVLGWMGFDWGYGFDRAVGETTRSGGHPHFIMGKEF